MVTITGSDTYFTNIASATDFTPTQWESLIDQAIDKINGYGAKYGLELPNMTGSAGSKSVSVTSAEAGWIRGITVAIYIKDYKIAGAESQSVAIGGLSSSYTASSGSSNSDVESLAEMAARMLKEIEVGTG